MARVAVDAMGGDRAPAEIVAGALRARRELGMDVLLVGDEVELKGLVDGGEQGVELVAAPNAIPMDAADPARALRAVPDSSIAVACRLVREGRADAVFSAGPTGATLAAALLSLGRLPGVSRPAVGLVLPFPGAPTVLVDAGANLDPRPEHMAGFALLGSVFAQVRLGLADPRVGLLSVGEEPGKGNELVKEAYPLLEASGVRFIGNVEGRDIPSDRVDVVVCDAFTGNVALKLLEGFAKFLMGELMRLFTESAEARAASEPLMPGLLDLAATLSPETHGGAQLLGVGGVCIIGHGASNAQAVLGACQVASQTAEGGLVARIAERMGRHGPGGTR